MAHEPPLTEFVPLTPAVLHILLALSSQPRHGYSIMQEMEKISDGQFQIGPTTLYRSIKQMLEKQLIEEASDIVDSDSEDERRKYYRITPFGVRVAQAELNRLQALVQTPQAHHLLKRSGEA
jgi:DNA-binding PadR family transcriptional regulator